MGDDNIQLSKCIGTYVRKLCLLNISQSIKTGNVSRCDGSKQFLEIFNAEWGDTVTASATRKTQQKRLNKTFLLPTEQDLKRFTRFLEEEILRETNYTRLQKLIMAALISFNKRRPAEVANVRISDYRLSFCNTEDREEILRRMSPEEQVLSQRCEFGSLLNNRIVSSASKSEIRSNHSVFHFQCFHIYINKLP
jgi:hypothetical protein